MSAIEELGMTGQGLERSRPLGAELELRVHAAHAVRAHDAWIIRALRFVRHGVHLTVGVDHAD